MLTHSAIALFDYDIAEQLYSGSRTLVYRAVRKADQQPVVIKLLSNEHPSFSELVQFRNQYTIAKNLNCPGIIQSYGLEPYRNGYAMVMEDFGGISLGQFALGKPLCLDVFYPIALQIADILHHLYRNRIIHKDIKLANILINPDTQQVKLIDFSIASLLPRETPEIQNPNILEGTLAYLSPEQTGRMNRGIDYRSDFYSLGVSFYQLLTGQLPFQSQDPMELVHSHLAKQPTAIHSLNPAIPPMLSEIVAKLMAKNAENRYQSALGLKHDLELCLSDDREKGNHVRFTLGERDICDRFLIPERLYGREAAVIELLSAFNRVSEGKTELLLVAGFSGIGKTAVVNEVHKPIVRQRGYFIKGKYDQFNRNIPLSAFVQALRDLMGQLFSESDAQLAQWKERILKALGENGQVAIEVIPELERIIGSQPPVPELSGSAAQNRFNLLFQKFIGVFTTKEHPLVMFLDDLQWADSASLNLMQVLMSQGEMGYLLLIGAYRDNEVSPAHPLMLTLGEIEKLKAIVNTLTLAPLSQADVNRLIADTLTCAAAMALPLTELIYQKTQGNPFFTTQFLKALYEDGLISFDFTPPTPPYQGGARAGLFRGNHGGIAPTENDDFVGVVDGACLPLHRLSNEGFRDWGSHGGRPLQENETALGARGGWQCDIAKVRALAITDDVVEFMAIQLQKLPAATQNVLKLAACIGNQFDLATLAIVSKQSETETAANLWKALQEGLILPRSEVYKFFQSASSLSGNQSRLETRQQITVSYKFLHDRIQQAAYSLIPDDQKQATHLKIGRLLRDSSTSDREERLFEIVNHLNVGIALIASLQERENLAELNLTAGKKAKTATAYAGASEYLGMGIKLLPADAWESHYPLTLALHEDIAEASYLNTDFEQMEQWASVVLQQAKTLLDNIKVQQTRILGIQAQGQSLEAIQIGLQVLHSLGIEFPEQPTQEDIGQAFGITRSLWADKPFRSLLDLRTMTDPQLLAAMEILTALVPPALQSAPNLMPLLMFKRVELSIRSGNCPISVFAYGEYGLILCGIMGDIENGYKFGELALNLRENLHLASLKCRNWHVVHTFVKHWKIPLSEVLPGLQEAYRSGLETGDIETACYAAMASCYYAYHAGQELGELTRTMQAYRQIIQQYKQASALDFQEIYQQTTLNLLGQAEVPYLLTGEIFNQKQSLPQLQANNQRLALFMWYINQTILYYLFGQDREAAQTSVQTAQYLDGGVGLFMIPLYSFYDALIQLTQYAAVSPEERQTILLQVQQHQDKLQHWAALAPSNHQHRWELIAAEKYRVLGNKTDAIEHYDRAITSAKANQFIQDEALANELAAKFYLNWGKEKVAAGYMQEAYYCYTKWGAKAKIVNLETLYPQLLQPILQQPKSNFNTLETLTNFTNSTTKISSTSIFDSLDFASVIQVAQSLSSAIELDELLQQLTQIILQNSGGNKCILVLPQNETWLVRAISTPETTELCSIPLDDHPNVPIKLIQYVKRTQSVVVIDNLQTDLPVIDDYLIQRNPKSVLCLPI
ncbi:MAG: serine/threonine-protein kinase PknK, partial [Oscillatoriales cyanobacterium]